MNNHMSNGLGILPSSRDSQIAGQIMGSASMPLSLPTDKPLLTLTHPKLTLWVIELHNGPDNRLTHDLINKGLKPALDIVEREWRAQREEASKDSSTEGASGALIIVGSKNQDKFFSNGLDFQAILRDPNFFQLTFDPFIRQLLVFPIPTIAAINGHCFAGGFLLAMTCDYRIMTDGSSRNAWLCMNEVHFGAAMPHSFVSIFRAKIGDHRLHRKTLLEGHRFTPSEALHEGILDYVVKGKTADVLAKAEEVANRVSGFAAHGVWGLIKFNLYRDVLRLTQKNLRIITVDMDEAAAKGKL